jgi:thiamine biosynthesis lipoprotein
MEPSRTLRNIFLVKRRSIRAPFLLGAFLALSLRAQDLQRFEFAQPEMGSVMRISLYARDAASAKQASDAAFDRVAHLNQVCSDYLPDSELIQLCRAGSMLASDDLFGVVALSQDIAAKTDGAFDITCGHYTQLWRRMKRKAMLPEEAVLAKARAVTGWKLVSLDATTKRIVLTKPGMQLDLGGIAKGFAADAALRALHQHGITRAVVAASGDMAVGDAPPGEAGWPISLRTFEAPEASDRLITLNLTHCGVSTSGDLHQAVEINGKRYSHIVDPATGLGLTERIACSVIAPNATTSDALATAMCVLGVQRGMAILPTFPGVRVRYAILDGESVVVMRSPDFPTP